MSSKKFDSDFHRRLRDYKLKKNFPLRALPNLLWELYMGAAQVDSRLKKYSWLQHLREIHPRAIRLILEYGVIFKRIHWEPRAEDYRVGKCYENAFIFATWWQRHGSKKELKLPEGPLLYVQGVSVGYHCWPMHHAWNSLGPDQSMHDVTLSSDARWIRYLGIPFTLEEYTHITGRERFIVPLFTRRNFPRYEGRIRTLLATRRRQRLAGVL